MTGLLIGFSGCRGNPSDRTVRVSQAPASARSPAEPVPSRLAGGLPKPEAGDPSLAIQANRTNSPNTESAVRQANRLEPTGMIGSEEGVDETRLMAAFEHADPQVQAIAKRQYQASLARAQAAPPRSPASAPTSPAPANAAPAPGSQLTSTRASITDAANDQGVPTLPGSAQRVADAQPDPGPMPASLPSEATPGSAEKTAAADAPAVRTASRSPDQDVEVQDVEVTEERAASSAAEEAAQNTAKVAEEATSTEDAEDAADATPSFEDRLAGLDEQRLYALLIDRYQTPAEGESEAAGLRRQINHRLLLTMAGRIDEAVEPLDGLAPSEQEYLRHQMLTLWTAIDPQGHPVSQRRWTSALPHLREATSYLAAATGKLDVSSLSFCTEVISFGRVKPFEADRFNAGQEVILYSEIDCFAAERLSDGYETHFNGSFEIFDAEGKRVADKVLPADRQAGKNYRRDYFIAYRMHLPSHLEAGSYRLELTIEDIKGQKYGSSSIPFQIEAKSPVN